MEIGTKSRACDLHAKTCVGEVQVGAAGAPVPVMEGQLIEAGLEGGARHSVRDGEIGHRIERRRPRHGKRDQRDVVEIRRDAFIVGRPPAGNTRRDRIVATRDGERRLKKVVAALAVRHLRHDPF